MNKVYQLSIVKNALKSAKNEANNAVGKENDCYNNIGYAKSHLSNALSGSVASKLYEALEDSRGKSLSSYYELQTIHRNISELYSDYDERYRIAKQEQDNE